MKQYGYMFLNAAVPIFINLYKTAGQELSTESKYHNREVDFGATVVDRKELSQNQM